MAAAAQLLRPVLGQGPLQEPQPVGWFQFGLEPEQRLAEWFRFDPELKPELKREQELPQAPAAVLSPAGFDLHPARARLRNIALSTTFDLI